jgi:putative spermidine/putrescine transport system ATP-binding protein
LGSIVRDEADLARGVTVALTHVVHRYGHDTLAVDDVSLAIAPGEMLVLLGPSGCGKTTLLRIVAGLVAQTSGEVAIGDQIVDRLPAYERGAGVVFQNYALFPHMSVASNIGYGLRARGASRRTIDETVDRMLRLVRMESYRARYPRELSGGQQQRVALARTLAVNPKVLLLDEPFGALDKNLRLDMQIEVKRLQRELGITTVMVTHDQEEAQSIADRIAVMSRGRIEQVATPDAIYDAPRTLFVAKFVGSASFLAGRLAREGGRWRFTPNAGGALAFARAHIHTESGAAVLVARPEHLCFMDDSTESVPAIVRMVLPLGPSIVHELSLADGTPVKVTTVRGDASPRPRVGDRVQLALAPGAQVSVFVPDAS